MQNFELNYDESSKYKSMNLSQEEEAEMEALQVKESHYYLLFNVLNKLNISV